MRRFSGYKVSRHLHRMDGMEDTKFMVQGTEAEVCADIARRQAMGINKYGTTVRNNELTLKQWLQHQYEELLDAAIYCKRAIEELEK
jgi:hypothetical protein